ncbi:ribosomal protein S8.e, partial [Trichinella nativa]
ILWSQASTYSELYKDLSSKIHLLEPYSDREQSFKFLVDSFGKKVSGEYKQKRMEELSFLNIQGKVDLTNPDNQFMLIEDYGKSSGLPPPENPVQIFFGRLIKFGMNKVVSRYNLKDRIFIGNTSMDPILSFLMANIGEVQSGDLVLDPYVGSGSILLPAAHFGGYCVGVEIDYNVLHGKSKPSRCTAIARHPDECIRANFKQYGLEAKYVDVLVADSSKSSIWTSHARFDCILTDPPYGIREKGAKVKRKQLPDFWLLKDRSTETVHYPSKAKYCLNDLVLDLLNFAATCLTEGGHLVYWLPVCKNQFDEAQIPKHPCLKIVSTSLQLLTKTYGRVLISMVKIREPSDYIEPETSKWVRISRDHWHKRRKTGGKRKPLHKKRKYELGRPPAMTKLGSKRIHIVRVRGGNRKYRALRLETGNYSWGSEGCTRKTRIIDVVYNASNNELVRTKTLVKSAIVVIDATPFRQWYENHYALPIGRKKGAKLTEQEEAIFNATRSKAAEKKLAKRRITAKVEPALEEQFQSGRLLACITSRPGQVGRADGYVLEGKELEFYLRKIKAKNNNGSVRGRWTEKRVGTTCSLGSLFTLLVILLSGAVIAGNVFATQEMTVALASGISNAMINYDTWRKNENKQLRQYLDNMQYEYECCGIFDWTDWLQPNEGTFSCNPKEPCYVPWSCCARYTTESSCYNMAIGQNLDYKRFSGGFHEKGCYSKLMDKYKRFLGFGVNVFAAIAFSAIIIFISWRLLFTSICSWYYLQLDLITDPTHPGVAPGWILSGCGYPASIYLGEDNKEVDNEEWGIALQPPST